MCIRDRDGSVYYSDTVEELSASSVEEVPPDRVADKRYFRRSLKNWRKLTNSCLLYTSGGQLRLKPRKCQPFPVVNCFHQLNGVALKRFIG